jgi:hypothetical protein
MWPLSLAEVNCALPEQEAPPLQTISQKESAPVGHDAPMLVWSLQASVPTQFSEPQAAAAGLANRKIPKTTTAHDDRVVLVKKFFFTGSSPSPVSHSSSAKCLYRLHFHKGTISVNGFVIVSPIGVYFLLFLSPIRGGGGEFGGE